MTTKSEFSSSTESSDDRLLDGGGSRSNVKEALDLPRGDQITDEMFKESTSYMNSVEECKADDVKLQQEVKKDDSDCGAAQQVAVALDSPDREDEKPINVDLKLQQQDVWEDESDCGAAEQVAVEQDTPREEEELMTVGLFLLPHGFTETIEVGRTISVAGLKDQVELKFGIPASQQRLVYNGRFLADEKLLEFYGIEEGHSIVMRVAVALDTPDREDEKPINVDLKLQQQDVWEDESDFGAAEQVAVAQDTPDKEDEKPINVDLKLQQQDVWDDESDCGAAEQVAVAQDTPREEEELMTVGLFLLPHGFTETIEVGRNISVAGLKDQVELKFGTPASQQRLVYNGRFLADEKLLEFYGIEEGNSIVMRVVDIN